MADADKRKYRRSAAAVIMDPSGRLLLCERQKQPGSWQFPQGGIHDGEPADAAVLREVEEEVGLRTLHIVQQAAQEYRYDFIASVPKWPQFRGQRQQWFLLRFDGPGDELRPDGREVGATRWVRLDDFPFELIVPMKRQVHEEVLREFAPSIRAQEQSARDSGEST